MRSTVHKLNRRGSVMVWIIAVSFILSIFAFFFTDSLIRRQKLTLDDWARFEASLLASDLVEVGKYLMLYERFFTLANPTFTTNCVRNMWGNAFSGFVSSSQACGYFNTSMQPAGTFTFPCGLLANPRAVCPSYIRMPTLNGDFNEQLRYELWTDDRPGGFLRRTVAGVPGQYNFVIDMTDAIRPGRQADSMIPLFFGQKIIRDRMGGLFGGSLLTANIRFDLYSNSGGYTSLVSERYLKITGTLVFGGRRGMNYSVSKSQTLMMLLSTPKDFALFMPYPQPTAADVGAAETTGLNVADTRRWNEAVQVDNRAYFHGRVYFNGEIRTNDLNSLPVFGEGATFSGSILRNDGTAHPPTATNLATLRRIFPKGFMANYSAERYLMDGACAPDAAGGPNRPMWNGVELPCTEGGVKVGMLRYLIRMAKDSPCWDVDVTVNENGIVATDGPFAAALGLNCAAQITRAANGVTFLAGGHRSITANGQYAPSISPSRNFIATNDSPVWGTVFTGHLVAQGANHFWALPSLRPGVPSIPTPEFLGEINGSGVTAYEGVTVDINRLPIVLTMGEEGG